MSTTEKTILSFCLAAFLGAGLTLSGQTQAIRGAEIHTMAGDVIASGVILIQGGKITAVGSDIPIPQGAEVIDASGFILYPGFIASSCSLASGEIDDFESVSPDYSALDRFDPLQDCSRFLAGGITAVYLDTPKNRLVSGKGAVVKLGTGRDESRVVREDAALRINLDGGAVLPPMITIYPAPVSPENPITPSRKQFPSSTLGAYWLIRNLFHSGEAAGDLMKYRETVASSLIQARERKIPLLVECRKAVDIHQAVELAAELKMPLIISGGTEAAQCADVLAQKNIPVIAESKVRPNDPDPDGAGIAREGFSGRSSGISTLISKGILVAVKPSEDRWIPDLLWIVQSYRKYGVSAEDLIKSITINPARIFGVDQRLGSLEKGKDADILFFQNEKGIPLPRLKKVMIEGKIVHEQN
jgi:imidazolonepropionase-like amidohydrolase